MSREEVMKMSEADFINHIIAMICDYATINGYEVTDTVKTMCENLIAITEIASFDKWEASETIDEQPKADWIPCEVDMPEEHDSMFAKFIGTDKWKGAMFEKI